MRLRRSLSSCLHVFAGFLTEDSYDFANSWAVKGADQSCHRVSSPSLSCNSSKDTSLVSETSMTHFVFDIELPPRVCVVMFRTMFSLAWNTSVVLMRFCSTKTNLEVKVTLSNYLHIGVKLSVFKVFKKQMYVSVTV